MPLWYYTLLTTTVRQQLLQVEALHPLHSGKWSSSWVQVSGTNTSVVYRSDPLQFSWVHRFPHISNIHTHIYRTATLIGSIKEKNEWSCGLLSLLDLTCWTRCLCSAGTGRGRCYWSRSSRPRSEQKEKQYTYTYIMIYGNIHLRKSRYLTIYLHTSQYLHIYICIRISVYLGVRQTLGKAVKGFNLIFFISGVNSFIIQRSTNLSQRRHSSSSVLFKFF